VKLPSVAADLISYNPSGRLPYTIAKDRADYSADVVYVNEAVAPNADINYTER
jgi:hypothetical protein